MITHLTVQLLLSCFEAVLCTVVYSIRLNTILFKGSPLEGGMYDY